jgi:hypothetical protein
MTHHAQGSFPSSVRLVTNNLYGVLGPPYMYIVLGIPCVDYSIPDHFYRRYLHFQARVGNTNPSPASVSSSTISLFVFAFQRRPILNR